MTKTRTLAQKLIKDGAIRVDGERITKTSATVFSGNVLTIAYAERIRIYKFLLPGTRRGPAKDAQQLYEDLSPPPIPKSKYISTQTAIREPGAGRPTKKQRRQTDILLNR